MTKRRLIAAFIIAILNVASGNGYGADLRALIEFKENGAIDWTTGVVEAKGIGVPPAYTYSGQPQTDEQQTLSQATKKAQHNLLETIVNLRINSESRVIDIVETYPSIMTQLRGMVQTAPEIENLRLNQHDGTVEVWSRMKLNGGFSQLILPPEIRHIEPIKQVLTPPNYSSPQSRPRSSEIFTGLVVDARTMRAVPVLAPRILDENLEEVFGPAYVSREFAVQHGVARYTTDIWKAKFDTRVSDNPLIAKALKVLWPGRCDFIISNADAAKLKSASEHLKFLKECRVIIVLDPM
ncbi:MAG: hypothetical protein V2I56_17910 [Desulfobacteraceae bacterium]|nr:hypothetical protein [Desulfobacteraceae bacterium]